MLGASLGGWLGDVGKLVQYVRAHGPLALELELESQREGLVEDLLAIIRARQAALASSPDALPSLLWNGLLDRGWSISELTERLRWPSKPSIRLRRGLEHIDRCWRALPHPDEAHGCAISSDGTLILSACDDGRVRLWSRVTGQELASFEHGGLVRACAMTADGRWAVSGSSNHTIKRWDLRTREAAGECTFADGMVIALAIDDQGTRVLAGDNDGRVLIWRPIEGSSEQLGDHDERLAGVAISPDGKMGLSGGKLDAVIWNLETDKRFAKLPDHEYTIGGVAIGSDGRRGYTIAIGESRRISLETGKVEHSYADLGRSIGCVAAGQGDQLLIGEGQRLGHWDMREGKPEYAIHAHAGDVEACATTSDASWVVSAGDTKLKIWPRDAFERPSGARWTGTRLILAASPDGTQAIVGGDESGLSIVEVASGRITGKLEVGGRINAVAWVDDDRLLTVGATSHELALWSVGKRTKTSACELGSDWLRDCAISPDRRHALIAGDEKRTWLVPLDDLRRDRALGTHDDWAHACRFSTDGSLALAVDGDAFLLIWSIADGSQRHRLKSDANYTYGALATINELAFAGGTHSLDVWDIDKGKLLTSLAVHVGKIHALLLADEGRVLISAGEDATLRLWRVGREPSVLATVVGHAPFTRVSLAGSLLLAGDAAGNVWELVVDWKAVSGS